MVKQCYYQNVQYVIKNQEANGILNNLGLKTPLNKISLLGDILIFSSFSHEDFILIINEERDYQE